MCEAGGGRERRGGSYRDQGEVRAEYGWSGECATWAMVSVGERGLLTEALERELAG